ncbi:flagellin [Clostridium butyricum]|uniref:flagellin n=1 Tax=Clostridium butyricum TaxID=1492 RepID=UPI0004883123|nr:flagellin [Clostridium butyricum]
MRLNKNMYSMNIYNNYKNKLAKNSTAMKNISSGLKLNKSKDNPNKIDQSESIKIQIISNSAAQRNVQDTTSMIQTFDGSMSEMNNCLSRLKELTVQAGNGAMTEEDRKTIQVEIDQLTDHITYMADNTEFNGVKLLNTDGEIKTMIGAFEGETTTIPQIKLTSEALGIGNLNVLDPDNIDDCNRAVDSATIKVSSARSALGAIQSRLEQSYNNIGANSTVLQGVQSNIADADIAEEMLKYSESQIFIQSAISLMAQSNKLPQDALQILSNIK